MGWVTGPGAADQLVQIMARTFHCQFGSVRIGGKGEASPKGALDYALRTGEYGRVDREKLEELERRKREAEDSANAKDMAKAKSDLDDAIDRDGKAAEFECAFGDRQEVRRAAELIEETAKVTSGGKSERLFIKETFELPAHATAWQREECARAIVDDWAKRDHPAVAVVHGSGRVQPHVHVILSARPIRKDGEGHAAADRSVRLLVGREAVRERRRQVADTINRTCAGPVHFVAGRHAECNIDRDARRAAGLMQTRLPGRARRHPGEYSADGEHGAVAKETRHAQLREERRQAEAEREREQADRHRTRVLTDHDKAQASLGMANERVREVAEGRAEPFEPIQVNDRQRKALESALGDASQPWDTSRPHVQALGFALLNLDRARARERETRRRRERLEQAEREELATLRTRIQVIEAEAQPIPETTPRETAHGRGTEGAGGQSARDGGDTSGGRRGGEGGGEGAEEHAAGTAIPGGDGDTPRGVGAGGEGPAAAPAAPVAPDVVADRPAAAVVGEGAAEAETASGPGLVPEDGREDIPVDGGADGGGGDDSRSAIVRLRSVADATDSLAAGRVVARLPPVVVKPVVVKDERPAIERLRDQAAPPDEVVATPEDDRPAIERLRDVANPPAPPKTKTKTKTKRKRSARRKTRDRGGETEM